VFIFYAKFDQLFFRGNAELAVKVFVVELDGVFGYAKFRHDFFRFPSGKVEVKDLHFRRGKGGDAILKKPKFLLIWNFRFRSGDKSPALIGFSEHFLYKSSFLFPSLLLLFLQKKMDSKKENLAYDIGNGKKLKINFNKLLEKPDADVDENRTCKNHRVGRFFDFPLNAGINNNRDHRTEIEKKIKKINAVERAVNFFKGGNTVDVYKRNGFVINIKISRACSNKKDKNADSGKNTQKALFIIYPADFHDDKEHEHRKKNRTEIGNPVCPKGRIKVFRNGKKIITAVNNKNRRKKQNKKYLLLIGKNAV